MNDDDRKAEARALARRIMQDATDGEFMSPLEIVAVDMASRAIEDEGECEDESCPWCAILDRIEEQDGKIKRLEKRLKLLEGTRDARRH